MAIACSLILIATTSGCSTNALTSTTLLPPGAQADDARSPGAELAALAANLSLAYPYTENNTCWRYVQRFIGNATALNQTCRSVLGYTIANPTGFHNWAECNITGNITVLEVTPFTDGSPGRFMPSQMYLPTCREPWNQSFNNKCLFADVDANSCVKEGGAWLCPA